MALPLRVSLHSRASSRLFLGVGTIADAARKTASQECVRHNQGRVERLFGTSASPKSEARAAKEGRAGSTVRNRRKLKSTVEDGAVHI
jgi:hypothetical protein